MIRLSRFSVSLQIILLVGAVSLGGMFASMILGLRAQSKQLTEQSLASAAQVSDTAAASLEYSMLNNNWTIAEQVVEAIVTTENVQSIRIVGPEGNLRVSSNAAEIDSQLEKDDPLCSPCHSAADEGELERTVAASDPARLVAVHPIRNQPQCTVCHAAENDFLGIVLVEAPSAEALNLQATVFWQMAGTALLTFVLLVALVTLALHHSVARPLQGLIRGLNEIGQGNLDYRFGNASCSEFDQLTRALDSMRSQLRRTGDELRRGNRELALLNLVGQDTSQVSELQPMLELAAARLSEDLGLEAACVFLHDTRGGQHELRVCRGVPGEKCREIGRIREESLSLCKRVSCTGEAVFVPDMAADARFSGTWDNLKDRSCVYVPLLSKGVMLGTLGLVGLPGRRLMDRDVELLKAVGRQLGIAVDNAQLYERIRSLAATEERERLAREMHDYLAQTLGILNLKASLIGDQVERSQFAEARTGLLELKQIALEMYTDVRESIFNLRTGVPSGSELLTWLHSYLDEYRLHYHLDVEMVVNAQVPPKFSAEEAVQISRIVQEALTNVRKHARATNASLRIERENGQVRVTLEDDGRGFDPQSLDGQGRQFFGLQIMRERAAGIGGWLELESQPGKGTRVSLTFAPQQTEGRDGTDAHPAG